MNTETNLAYYCFVCAPKRGIDYMQQRKVLPYGLLECQDCGGRTFRYAPESGAIDQGGIAGAQSTGAGCKR